MRYMYVLDACTCPCRPSRDNNNDTFDAVPNACLDSLLPEEPRVSLLVVVCSHYLIFLYKSTPLLAPDLYSLDGFCACFSSKCSTRMVSGSPASA
jgi:hypothetical protein